MATKKPTFEEAMVRLEEIVGLLENGDAPLESSLKLFEEGTALMKSCTTALEKAEQTVKKLTVNADGEEVVTSFEGVE